MAVVISGLFLGKVVFLRFLCDASLQRTLNRLPCQIVCACRESSGEQSFGLLKSDLRDFLKVGAVHNFDPVLRSAHIRAFAGIHADFFAGVDEGGDLDHEAGLELGRLCDARSSR